MTDEGDRLTGILTAVGRDLLISLERRVGPDDAPDALAETMVVAWLRIADLPADDEGARRWLYGIARHVLFNLDRGRRRRTRLAARLLAVRGRWSAPAADEGSEVRDAIARLAPDLAEIVRLVHWDGFSLSDAAEIVGIPASTARGRYQRAKEELRGVLTPTA